MAVSQGIEHEIVDGRLLLFQHECGHWIAWRLHVGRGGSPESAAAKLLRGVARGRMHCWKCSEDRWRRRNRQPARYSDDDRERTLREIG